MTGPVKDHPVPESLPHHCLDDFAHCLEERHLGVAADMYSLDLNGENINQKLEAPPEDGNVEVVGVPDWTQIHDEDDLSTNCPGGSRNEIYYLP